MSYTIHILFGKEEILRHNLGIKLTKSEKVTNLKTFSFLNKKEANIFLRGMAEVIGWTEYLELEKFNKEDL
ncbi:MAG: hypothetical protein WDA22_02905 [Bacteroidota bacterium]